MQLIYFHKHLKNPQKWTRHKPNVFSKYSNTVFGLLHIWFCFLSLLSYCNNKTYHNHLIFIISLSGWARHWWGSWNKWTWWSQGKLKIKDMLWFRIWFICHFEKMKCVLLYRPTVNGITFFRTVNSGQIAVNNFKQWFIIFWSFMSGNLLSSLVDYGSML